MLQKTRSDLSSKSVWLALTYKMRIGPSHSRFAQNRHGIRLPSVHMALRGSSSCVSNTCIPRLSIFRHGICSEEIRIEIRQITTGMLTDQWPVQQCPQKGGVNEAPRSSKAPGSLIDFQKLRRGFLWKQDQHKGTATPRS